MKSCMRVVLNFWDFRDDFWDVWFLSDQSFEAKGLLIALDACVYRNVSEW